MNQNAIRITAASLVIVGAAAVSLAVGGDGGKIIANGTDPSVPPAYQALQKHDAKADSNVVDLTF